MGRKALIMGESGTGKTASMRNLNPARVAIVNPVGKELSFKGKFETLDSITESRKIIKFMKEQVDAGKKVIVIDDFQYILSVPYMNRIKEAGWDKWNDLGANYFGVIEAVKDLPDDVVVYFFTHTETLENGVTTIKLIGKLLREKITIEDMAEIVDLNPIYLGSLFKKEIGLNFSSYLIKVRIDAAKSLLIETNYTIAAIGSEVGYKDTRYFSQLFEKTVGIKPALYRKIHS